jgi:hypothetical protein
VFGPVFAEGHGHLGDLGEEISEIFAIDRGHEGRVWEGSFSRAIRISCACLRG